MNSYLERTLIVGVIIGMVVGAINDNYWLPLIGLIILLCWVIVLKPFKRISISLEPFVDPNPREVNPKVDPKDLEVQTQSDSDLAKQAIQDLVHIINSLNTGRFTRTSHFAERVDEALKRNLIKESQLDLRTQSVIKIHSIKSIETKPWSLDYFWHYVSFAQFMWGLRRKLQSQVVEIRTMADYYWLVEEQKSGLPGELDDDVRLNESVLFMLRYEMHNGQPLLVHYYDSMGGEFGEDVMQRD